MNYFTRISTAVMTLTIVVTAGYGIGIKSAEAATETFNSSTSWTVPADVCEVTVHAWGAGGGAGKTGAASAGGGGGAFASSTISVTPGQSHTVTVGAGGGQNASGGNSWFSSTATVLAAGGDGGVGVDFGLGGAAANSVGALTRSGGNGGAPTSGGNPGTRRGGGGGGSATFIANGGNGADGPAGGAGGTGEGVGGDGNVGAGAGGNGSAPGGAGGAGGGDGAPGAGAAGRIVLTYFTDPGCYVPPTLTLSGTLYSDEGVTPITTGKTINLAVGTTTTSVFSTTTVSGAGTYSFTIPANALDPGDPIAIWLDGDATKASLISTIGASTTQSVTGLDLYGDTVIVRNGFAASTTSAAVVEFYDNADDADLQYAASSTGATFSVLGGQTFYIWEGYRFQAPASTTYSGSFHNDSGTYFAPTGTTTFSGTSATISGTTTATSSLGNVVFTGSYTVSNDTEVGGLTIASSGSLTAPSGTLTVEGNFTNSGTFGANGGTVEFVGPSESFVSGSLTGSNAFNNLTVMGGVVQVVDALEVVNMSVEGAGAVESLEQISNPATLPVGTAYAATFSPDGTYLVIGHLTTPFVTIYKRSGDTFTKLSDPASLPSGAVGDLAFSPDGVYLSAVSNMSPYITIYKRSGDTFTKLTDPATLPTGSAFGTAFSPDGTYLSVGHGTTPFVTIYKRSGDTFTKLSDPATLPAATGQDVAFSPDGTYLSVAHALSPYITIYKRSGDTFTKLSDPATLPPNSANGVAFSPDGTYLSVAHASTPFVTIYKRSGDTFTKLSNPATLPTSHAQEVAFSPDGEYLTVGHFSSPYVTIYKREGDLFTKVPDFATFPGDSGLGIAYSNDNQYLSLTLGASPYMAIYKRSPGAQLQINDTVTITGDFTNTGVFIATTTSTVILSGTSQALTSTQATTTLHNLTKNVASADTLTFTASSSFAFTGTLTLTGTSGNLLSLRSSTSGVPYYLDPQATTTVEYLDVQDAYNFATSAIDCTTGCVDSGNNTNWSFTSLTAPAVTTSAAASVGTSSAVLSGNITNTGGENVTTRGFIHSTDNTFATGVATTSASGSFGTGAYSLGITGLANNTTYYVRAFATNSAGTSYGATESFSTLVALPSVTTGAASLVEATTATLNGTINALGGENATARGFIYSTDNTFVTGVATSTESGSYGTGAYSLGVTALSASTTYYVRAFATNSAGTSYGATESFTTTAAGDVTFSSAANQEFYLTQASTTLTILTITEPSGAGTITAANDIRIAIASTTDFRFTTGSTTPTFGGTAAGKVAATVSFEDDGTTLVVDVTTNFAASDTLTIGAVSVGSFGAVTDTPGSLALHTDGDVVGSPAATDAFTVTITGLLTQTAHPSGQVGNAFDSSSASDAVLLAWELQATGEAVSVTELVVSLTGAANLTAGDFSDIRLYRDLDDSRTVSGGDELVGGAGSLNLGGGTITFSEAFTVATTTAVSYLLVSDLNSLAANAAVTATLNIDGYTTAGVTSGVAVYGAATVASAAHERILVGMISRGGGGNRIGAAAPAGDATQTGGGGGGGSAIDPNTGDTLTAEAGTYVPTIAGAFESGWTNGGNALASDGVYATSNSVANNSYSTFNISLPSGDTIAGIIVRLEASATTPAGTIEVALSTDAGETYTSTKATPVLSATDTIYTLGGNSDLWGRSWTAANFSNANFVVRVIAQPDGNTVRIDALQVEPVHQTGGGGGGGGGRL